MSRPNQYPHRIQKLGNSLLRTSPESKKLCQVKKNKEVLAMCYASNTGWWYIKAKKCEDHIWSSFLIISHRMFAHRDSVDSIADKKKKEQIAVR